MRLFVAAVVALALVLAGCGGSAKSHHASPPPPSQADRIKAVVRTWTANLDAENNAAEVRLFSLPVLINTGPDLFAAGVGQCWCLTPADILQFHAQIPCSVEIVSIKVRGRYAMAVLRLGDRLLSKCSSAPGPDTTGWLTGVRFTIVRGKITGMEQDWWRRPDGMIGWPPWARREILNAWALTEPALGLSFRVRKSH
jgi:hypothetical protein